MVSAAAAAVVCFDSNKDVFITDAEESDNSQCDDNTSSALLDFWTCIQCKRQNNNPQYRFCDKCYQVVISVKCAVDLHALPFTNN